ncbi:MAG: ABC transporter ATP-binding protein [Clostridia bacterium]|nr:ABC transporter ATP-binding protein [Clostridia bacterium]
MKIEAKNLSKIYIQGDKEIEALKDVTLSIEEGKFTAVIGPSGSGKSTLLRALAALEAPTSGSVIYDGRDIYAMSEGERAALRRRSIGTVYQDYSLLPTLTALENICTPCLMDGKKPDADYVLSLCKTLGIFDRVHHLPGEMSGGEQQRTAVARALVNRPSILFADEPTGNLDKTTAAELLELLLVAKAEYKQTLLMVTHDPDIAAMADVVIRMENGSGYCM